MARQERRVLDRRRYFHMTATGEKVFFSSSHSSSLHFLIVLYIIFLFSKCPAENPPLNFFSLQSFWEFSSVVYLVFPSFLFRFLYTCTFFSLLSLLCCLLVVSHVDGTFWASMRSGFTFVEASHIGWQEKIAIESYTREYRVHIYIFIGYYIYIYAFIFWEHRGRDK